MKGLYYTILRSLLCCVVGFWASIQPVVAQELWSVSGSIGVSPLMDFVVGEPVAVSTSAADIGFLSSLYWVSERSDIAELREESDICVTFYPPQESAVVALSQSALAASVQYYVYDTSGILYLRGEITTSPYRLDYSPLSAGIYILRIVSGDGCRPYVTRWIKNR